MYRIELRLLLTICFLLVAVGCSEDQTSVAQVQPPEKVVQVDIEPVQAQDLTEFFTLPGTLEAQEDLEISAEISGPVRHIPVVEGAKVKDGDLLLEIDSDSLQNSYERDLENYQVNKRKYERYQKLIEEGLVSQQELDELQNSMTAANAALRQTKLQLEKSRVIAPIDGVVDRLFIDRGEFVDQGQPLLRLVQVDQLNVIVDVPEKDVPFLEVGQSAEIIPAVISGRDFSTLKGTIEHIAYAANPQTRTYRTKLLIDNSKGLLRAGMIVRSRFVRQQLNQVISVPLYAVVDRNGEKIVFVEENGFARKIMVATGNSIGQRVLIDDGLETGQKLVVKGQQLLIDGARIRSEER